MPRHLPRLTALALAAATLPGCVPNKVYNNEPDQYLQRLDANDQTGVPADLAVIEFDDQGVFWQPDQLEAAIDAIRTANSEAEEGTLVIVYMHGWKNNADPDDPDGALERFRRSVRANASRNPTDRPFAADRVVGVFLGWRGGTSNIPLQEQLTFWDRRRTGERIASIHMHEALLRIMQATKEHAGSKCFVVGHSMGGMIIGKTMSPMMTTLLLSAGEEGTQLPLDLVILQNPALDALASWQFIELLKRFDATLQLRSPAGDITPARGPLIASISSEGDRAISHAYPFGRTAASWNMAFRNDHEEGAPSQRHLATHALGHVDYLTSHRAYLKDGEVVIEPIQGAFNDTPFWVISVAKEISKDHGDVNNPTYGRMIEQLLQLNQVYRTDLESWMVVHPPHKEAATPPANDP